MTDNRYWWFLEELRKSGKINMYGAAPYLAKAFNLTMIDAHKILIEWMNNYNPDDYD